MPNDLDKRLSPTSSKKAKAEERPMNVLIYFDTGKLAGDRDHLKVFANTDAAET